MTVRGPLPHICARCKTRMTTFIVSMFNRDEICMDCKNDEYQAPGYREAEEADRKAFWAGDRNYLGLGLSAADREFLARKRAARTKEAQP